MKCPKCQTENREGRESYSKYDSLLQILCPSYKAVNELLRGSRLTKQ